MTDPKMTPQRWLVLSMFLDMQAALPKGEVAESYGTEIVERTRLGSGTVHSILVRLEKAGWLTSRWEDAEGLMRPPRRFYRINPERLAAIDDAMGRAQPAIDAINRHHP